MISSDPDQDNKLAIHIKAEEDQRFLEMSKIRDMCIMFVITSVLISLFRSCLAAPVAETSKWLLQYIL